MAKNKTNIVKDLKAKSILVSRTFDAPLALVWRAYSERELLDQWWGPSPWRAETKAMNFKAGGHWLYAMVSPEGEKHWGKMEYTHIHTFKQIDIEDSFCNEEGTINHSLPISIGSIIFTETQRGILVEFKMTYPTEKEVQTLIEMGFETGISIGLDQLEILLSSSK